jgi:hypothetical protein
MMRRSRYLFSLAATACVAVSSYLMAGMSTLDRSLAGPASGTSRAAVRSTADAPQVPAREQLPAQDPAEQAECQLPEIPRQARLFPANLSTLVGEDQLVIRVSRGQLKVTAADLAAVASSVSLTMWPEGTIVDIDAQSVLVDGGGELRIVSTRELSDGWYRLKASMPEGVKWRDGTSGEKVSLFRVGSEPVVQQASICDKRGGRTKVELEFSEPLDPSSDAVFDLVDRAGRTLGCSPASLGVHARGQAALLPHPAPDGTTAAALAKPEPRLTFDCPVAIAPQDLRLRKVSGQVASFGRDLSLDPLLLRGDHFKQEGPHCVKQVFETPQSLVSRQ